MDPNNLKNMTLRTATLIALIGTAIGALFQLAALLNYFNLFTFANLLVQISLVVFFVVLYLKQSGKGE